MPTIQDAEDVHQEAVSTGTLVAVDVQNNDVVLDGNSGGASGRVQRIQKTRRARAEEPVSERGVRLQGLDAIREDDCASTA